ncbi:hypothetical protein C8R43DRAFT_950097 [Mycena crocata]|nr:hypothetical protein C8R43DRAFT_950097 [Mycena crocata]
MPGRSLRLVAGLREELRVNCLGFLFTATDNLLARFPATRYFFMISFHLHVTTWLFKSTTRCSGLKGNDCTDLLYYSAGLRIHLGFEVVLPPPIIWFCHIVSGTKRFACRVETAETSPESYQDAMKGRKQLYPQLPISGRLDGHQGLGFCFLRRPLGTNPSPNLFHPAWQPTCYFGRGVRCTPASGTNFRSAKSISGKTGFDSQQLNEGGIEPFLLALMATRTGQLRFLEPAVIPSRSASLFECWDPRHMAFLQFEQQRLQDTAPHLFLTAASTDDCCSGLGNVQQDDEKKRVF